MLEEVTRLSELTVSHPDEFTLLRFTAGDLLVGERQSVTEHLAGCRTCARVRDNIGQLDLLLRGAARRGDLDGGAAHGELAAGDPFRRRPEPRVDRAERPTDIRRAALDASAAAQITQNDVLGAAFDPAARHDALERLCLGKAADRFALLYALQSAGVRIAENPVAMMRLGEEAIARLRRRDESVEPGAERMVPRLALLAQAHQLVGQACNWTSEFGRAGSHLEIAYVCFGRATGDEMSLATVELLESQRRFFLDRPEEALVLARRAEATFEDLDVEDSLARSRVARGIALFSLGRHEEALTLFREAALVFDRLHLWSNSINCLNNIGACLQKMGRLDEARREYARALRRFSRDHRRSLAFVRHGLAEVLFSASRYREAALSLFQAVRLYSELELSARALTASLLEIESWARAGDLPRARQRLDIFQAGVLRHPGLDPSVSRQIQDALCGRDADFERVGELRREMQQALRRQDWQASA